MKIDVTAVLTHLIKAAFFVFLFTLTWPFVQFHFPFFILAQISISLSTIQKGYYSGIHEPLKIVIRDQDQWAALWTRHTSIQVNAPPPPEVDFSGEMVVGIFLGEKRTGGYEVEIIRAEQTGSTLGIHYREKSPPQTPSSPWH